MGLILCWICLVLVLAQVQGQHEGAVTKEMTELLKRSVTWKVVDYDSNVFKGWSKDDLLHPTQSGPSAASLCAPASRLSNGNRTQGTEAIETVGALTGVLGNDIRKLPISARRPEVRDLPAEFDARVQWPQCRFRIRDQGKCGSCWAVAVSESLSDRFCILRSRNVELSFQDILSCDRMDHGCNGGWITTVLNHLTATGAVSDECFPYVSGLTREVPPCPTQCVKSLPWIRYKCMPGSVKAVITPDAMKAEIMAHGPVTTIFEHYDDLQYYNGGVYYHYTGDFIALHALKVLGWGVEDGLDYWLCANSHGKDFGEKGYLKVKMGDCGIDHSMAFCLPTD